MNVWDRISGMLEIELTSAEPTAVLHRLNRKDVHLQNILYLDDMRVRFSITRKDYPEIERVTAKNGDKYSVKRKKGLYWLIRSLGLRPLLLVGLIFLLFITLALPSRIFIVRVEGNKILPEQMILERAGECGIGFGTRRRIVRSEKMKNALLSAMPELEWAGINTSGCVAVIQVREKEPDSQLTVRRSTVSSIVAARDGIIVSGTVLKGSALFETGQAVKKGQTLVSGYTDLGLTIRATAAEAEVYGQTIRDLQLILPDNTIKRECQISTERKYSLLIGKKLINFYKDSGICDTTCVKIYKENYMTLPGGVELPLAIVTEEWTYYEVLSDGLEAPICDEWLVSAANDYILEQMVSGQILDSSSTVTRTEDAACLESHYSCVEMIGQVKIEENIHDYGEYDGKNR